MSSTVITVTDDFDRAAGGLGANWTTGPDVLFPPLIVANQVPSNALDHESCAFYSGAAFTDNQFSQITLVSFVSGSSKVQLWVRASGTLATADGYRVDFRLGDTRIMRVLGGGTIAGGTEVELARDVIITFVNGDSLQVIMSGPRITAYINGVLTVTVVDAAFTSGVPGFGLRKAGVVLDTFVAGSVFEYLPRT